ncbi:head GIN domain-containing protein [Salmonirosea aquatica]|uniref:DUF2807 domain-containing protein n=1 Tax=Salmonirosea aquatica TaxID=2654236 RepID=A0A7C9BK18_9BACT|nr:DUF2807 domain-containing protein [Cytophagaceae bacterium SJW1-29]
MKQYFSLRRFSLFSMAMLLAGLQSCIYINTRDNDIPPRGVSSRTLDLANFDQLALGSAFTIHVEQGADFSVKATGELNDLDDLETSVSRSGVLEIRYRNTWRTRRERMDIDIVVPSLRSVDFSGASNSTVEGFEKVPVLDYRLSGASKSVFTGSADRLIMDLSGASELDLRGSGGVLVGDLSGASQVFAFDYPVAQADLDLSGASRARLRVANLLKVEASGASSLRYRGDPTIEQRLSGGSSVTRE